MTLDGFVDCSYDAIKIIVGMAPAVKITDEGVSTPVKFEGDKRRGRGGVDTPPHAPPPVGGSGVAPVVSSCRGFFCVHTKTPPPRCSSWQGGRIIVIDPNGFTYLCLHDSISHFAVSS